MGISVEFCPDLALRKFGTSERKTGECLPEKLEVGKDYEFLKKGQKNYWMVGEIPLRITGGNGVLSKPVASVIISEATHFLVDGEIWTKGSYNVVETYDLNDTTIHFDGLEKVT